MLIDTHAHLTLENYDDDQYEVIERAVEAGVERIITVGIDRASSQAACLLAQENEHVYAACGIHPNTPEYEPDDTYAVLDDLLQAPKVVACGEIGLDYYHEYTASAEQKERFLLLCKGALALDLPVIMHARNAYDDLIVALDDIGPGLRGVVHCFSGTSVDCDKLLERGFYISFCGNISYPKAANLRQIITQVPIEYLLLETDSPFLPPQSCRGKRNEPAFLAENARCIAEILGMDTDELAEITTQNAYELFGFENV